MARGGMPTHSMFAGLPDDAEVDRKLWSGRDDSGRVEPRLDAWELEWYGAEIERAFPRYVDDHGDVKYYVTDRRGQVVVRRCGICRNVEEIQLSHVYPRWTDLAAKEGGVVLGRLSADKVNPFIVQSPAKHYILCRDCEQLVSRSERYVRHLSSGTPEELAKIGVTLHPGNVLQDASSTELVTFAASVLLRSHHAPSAPHIRLRHDEAEWLRSSIASGEFSPEDYSLVVTKVFSRIPQVGPLGLRIRYFHRERKFIRFETLVGGYYWFFAMRSPSTTRPRWRQNNPLLDFLLAMDIVRSPVVRIGVNEIQDLNIVQRWIEPLELGSSMRRAPAELGYCPCGWDGREFDSCCANRWWLG